MTKPMAIDTTQALSPDTFKLFFDRLKPDILTTWPQLSAESLTTTKGSLEAVIKQISAQTGQPQNVIQERLSVLFEQCQTLTKEGQTGEQQMGQISSEIDQLVKRILQRTEAAIAQLNAEALPELKNTVHTYPAASLIGALGVGFLIGFTVRGTSHDRR